MEPAKNSWPVATSEVGVGLHGVGSGGGGPEGRGEERLTGQPETVEHSRLVRGWERRESRGFEDGLKYMRDEDRG